MKKFLIKTLLFISLLLTITLLVLAKYSQGYVDDYYYKLSTPKTNALIIGSSVGSCGLIPSLVAKDTRFEKTLFNFAFTNANSPYGEVYMTAIARKIKNNTSDGLFIVEVNPFVLGTDTLEKMLPETNRSLGNLYCVSCSPNFEYLLKKYPKPLYKLVLKNNSGSKGNVVSYDGWLFSGFMDEKKRAENIKNGLKRYSKTVKTYKLSEYRVQYLKKTIALLKSKGTVYMIRMPKSKEMVEMESRYFPEFNSIIEQIANENSVTYFDYSKIPCETNDLNHLTVGSAVRISSLLNKDLKIQ